MNITVKQLSLTEHFEDLLKIWETAFPQDAAFALCFLNQADPFTECFAVLVDDVPVSAAYFLRADLHIRNKNFSARYVYAVGTLPQYRNQGFAAMVLQKAAMCINTDMFFLYPANESLRAYYTRLGYRDILTQKHLRTSGVQLPVCEEIADKPFDAKQYCVQRSRYLLNSSSAYAVFPENLLQMLLQHTQVMHLQNATALIAKTDDGAVVLEMLCDECCFDQALQELSAIFPSKSVEVRFPGGDKGGMVLPLSQEAINCLENLSKEPFFGTFFDV